MMVGGVVLSVLMGSAAAAQYLTTGEPEPELESEPERRFVIIDSTPIIQSGYDNWSAREIRRLIRAHGSPSSARGVTTRAELIELIPTPLVMYYVPPSCHETQQSWAGFMLSKMRLM